MANLTPDMLALGLIWYVVFLFSLTCHEAAHALAAKLGGDLTAYEGGQVTLNPLPHVQRAPFGTIVVPILSFILSGWMIGWASAPYDPHWEHRFPKRAGWMALAGPAANFTLVLVATILIHICLAAGAVAPADAITFTQIVAGPDPDSVSPLAVGLSVLFSLNLLLGVFNLIPVPPLDGATVVNLFISDDAARRFAAMLRGGPFMFLGILIAWRILGAIYVPVFRAALKLIYPGG